MGTNLLSHLIQGAYDKTNAPRKAEQEIAERPETLVQRHATRTASV